MKYHFVATINVVVDPGDHPGKDTPPDYASRIAKAKVEDRLGVEPGSFDHYFNQLEISRIELESDSSILLRKPIVHVKDNS